MQCVAMLGYAWLCLAMLGYAWLCLAMLGYAYSEVPLKCSRPSLHILDWTERIAKDKHSSLLNEHVTK